MTLKGFAGVRRPGAVAPADPVAEAIGQNNVVAAPDATAAPVLALDLATKTGWALRTSAAVSSGSKSFAEGRGENRGERLWRFTQWLTAIHNAHPLSLVAYEAQAGPQRAGYVATDAYGQFEGVLLLFCARHSIPTRTVNPSTLKKAIAGHGHAKKPAMVAAVRALGFTPGDDNEADALAVLHWTTIRAADSGIPRGTRKAKRPAKSSSSSVAPGSSRRTAT